MNTQGKKTMSKNVTLGYLGYKFQTELINQILHPANKKFADRIIDIVQDIAGISNNKTLPI